MKIKHCTMEWIAILFILLVAWMALVLLDLAVAGLLAICGITFKKAFLWGLLPAIVLPVLMLLYGTLIERNRCRVESVELTFGGLPEAFDGYRIAHISDLHLRSYGKRPEALRKVVSAINGTGADMIAFTGDLVTLSPEELDAAVVPATGAVDKRPEACSLTDILTGLRAPDGVLSVLGNHDYLLYGPYDSPAARREGQEALIAREQAMGWDLLIDGHRIISRGQDSIAVLGVGNWSASRHFPAKGDLARASEGTEGLWRIVLSHDPTHWDAQIVGHDYPLTLSGHTHAIQFSLFGWCPSKYVFRQYRGLYAAGGQYLYVNPGLGETIFPARIGVVPEITLITLRAGK